MPITSLKQDGTFNPAALNIEFDIPVFAMHQPSGSAILKIWGLSIKDLGAALNLNPSLDGKKFTLISIYGGMSAGLPLANPAQARLLIKGQIFQAFGNWIGLEQTVDFIIMPQSAGNSEQPVNYTLNWLKGTALGSALQTTFQTAIPSATFEIALSPRLVQDHDEPSVHGSLIELASYLNPLSKRIITDADYPGVSITYDGATLRAFDLKSSGGPSANSPPIHIAFQDLIGQPTWIAPNVIQAKCVLRGDLDLFTEVVLPPSAVTTTSPAQSNLAGNPSNFLTFSGNYTVREIHHYGNFRQPDSSSWVTVINMIPSLPS